jgi:hypothetical protein
MLTKLTEIFSTRELALLVWIAFIVGLLSISGNVRRSMLNVLKAFLAKQIVIAFLLLAIYVLAVLYLLSNIQLWDWSLAKDSVFWFFTVALVIFFDLNSAQDSSYFRGIVFDSIKWIVIIEFLINFYTFSLWLELVLVPLIIFVTLIHGYSSTKSEYKQVERMFNNIISLIGLAFFAYAGYKTIAEYKAAFTVQNLKSLLHPIFMTVVFLPFVYMLALIMKYEMLFVRISILPGDKKHHKMIKRQIVWTANVSINRLKDISSNLNEYIDSLINKSNHSR